jgi:predicted ArsR family transcriptional regulator
MRPSVFIGRGIVSRQGERRDRAGWLNLVADPIRLHILRSLAEVGNATATDLANWGRASNQTMRRHLDAMVAFGVVDEQAGESDGQTPGRPAARFSLRPGIRESVRGVFDIAA